jgi:hypothetical protein
MPLILLTSLTKVKDVKYESKRLNLYFYGM